MSNKQNDMIEERFTDLIREQLTDEQFWAWVSGWYDVESIIEAAEEWDIEDKFEAVIELERMLAKSRKKRKDVKTEKKGGEKK